MQILYRSMTSCCVFLRRFKERFLVPNHLTPDDSVTQWRTHTTVTTTVAAMTIRKQNRPKKKNPYDCPQAHFIDHLEVRVRTNTITVYC